MANAYRTWYFTAEEDWVLKFDSFLVNVVGWYRAFTHSDTGTDRRYSWVSEGESEDGRPARIIHVQGQGNVLRLDCGLVQYYNFATGSFGAVQVGVSALSEIQSQNTGGRGRSVANKDRAWVGTETSATTRWSGYLGHIDSFYDPSDDPEPVFVRGQNNSSDDWTSTTNLLGLRTDNTEVTWEQDWNIAGTVEGYPNPRNGQFSFFNGFVYHTTIPFTEVRGRIKGGFYCKPDRLGHGSFVEIDDDFYLVTKTTDETDAIAWGPVSENGAIPNEVVQLGFPNYPYLKVDYGERGFVTDSSVSGTLAHWRFDTGHLNNYVYGSGSTLPVPSSYADELGSFNLAPQNGLTSVISRLREAADFNGSSQYATAAGHPAAVSGTLGEWTVEMVFKPDAVPVGANKATIIDYGAAGETSAQNTLVRCSLTAASGTTPNSFNVQLGNIELFWETGSGSDIRVATSSDFVQQDRWNYLAVTKKFNGLSYDVDFWHCSFGDFCVPSVKASIGGVTGPTGGGSSSWFVGANSTPGDYYNGQVDEIRMTKRVLTQSEIEASCQRVMI